MASWRGAGALRARLRTELEPQDAAAAWDWYGSSSFISCPVRTAGGRTLGVLAISRSPPRRPLSDEDLRVTEVFASLAALALERSELLEREARRARKERAPAGRRARMSASLELDAVYAAIVEQARRSSTGAPIALRALRAGDGRPAHRRGVGFTEAWPAHALPRRRGDDRPSSRDRRVLRRAATRTASASLHVHRARGHRVVRPRPDRARAAAVRRADRQPRAARLWRARARAPRVASAGPRPARSPTRSTSSASAGSRAR